MLVSAYRAICAPLACIVYMAKTFQRKKKLVFIRGILVDFEVVEMAELYVLMNYG